MRLLFDRDAMHPCVRRDMYIPVAFAADTEVDAPATWLTQPARRVGADNAETVALAIRIQHARIKKQLRYIRLLFGRHGFKQALRRRLRVSAIECVLIAQWAPLPCCPIPSTIRRSS